MMMITMSFCGFDSEVGDFDDSEEKDNVDEENQRNAITYSQFPEATPPWIKYHLLKKPAVGGMPMSENAPTKKPTMVSGILVKKTVQGIEVSLPGLGENDSGEEDAQRHKGVGDDVVDRANQSHIIGKPHPANHVAHLHQ